MPEFEIHGKGIKSGRKRKRTYTANSPEDAKAMALKDETEVLEIIELPPKSTAKKKAVSTKKAKPAVATKTVKKSTTKKTATKTSTAKKTATKKASPVSKTSAPAPKAKVNPKPSNVETVATSNKPVANKTNVIKKTFVSARSDVINSPHWTWLPKTKNNEPTSLFNSINPYLFIMIAFLAYIMFYYFNG